MDHSGSLQISEKTLSYIPVPTRKIPVPSFPLPAVYSKLGNAEEVRYPLTIEEAHHFLENVLRIEEPAKRLMRDRLGFLNDFTRRMYTEVPYTNLNEVYPDLLPDKKPPSLQKCKESILNGWGGICLYINMFSKALLDLLGFKTHHIGGANPGDTILDTHSSVVVCDVIHPGSRHIVETGTYRPIYQAISIDFEEESPIYEFCRMKFKFFKRDHGIILSCSLVPKPSKKTPNIFESGGNFWKTDLVYWSDVSRSRAYFTERIKNRLTFPTLVPKHYETIGFYSRGEDNCFLLGSNGKLFLKKYYGREEQQFLSQEEWLDCVAKEFPQYPREIVAQAIQNVNYARKRHNYHLPSLM